MKKNKICIASDHAGIELKKYIINTLNTKYEFINLGTNTKKSIDYPDYAKKLCIYMEETHIKTGILICGTGIGMSIAANKQKNIRAAVCFNEYTAKMARNHNNANVLCLGSRVIGEELAISIVETFLKTGFEGGRHLRRVNKLTL